MLVFRGFFVYHDNLSLVHPSCLDEAFIDVAEGNPFNLWTLPLTCASLPPFLGNSPHVGTHRLVSQPEPFAILCELHQTCYAIPVSAQTHSGFISVPQHHPSYHQSSTRWAELHWERLHVSIAHNFQFLEGCFQWFLCSLNIRRRRWTVHKYVIFSQNYNQLSLHHKF